MAVRLYYHVYIPEYELQGPTAEFDKPLDRGARQKMVKDFFDWLKGKQPIMKEMIAKGDLSLHVGKGKGFVSRKTAILMVNIRKRYGAEAVEGLTTQQYDDIYRGKKYAAKWFKD